MYYKKYTMLFSDLVLYHGKGRPKNHRRKYMNFKRLD